MSSPFYQTPEWKALRKACLARDGYQCVVPGCGAPGRVADHIVTRPNVPYLCELDRLDNLRTLCKSHDSQVKEQRDGKRGQGGAFRVKGCDADGRSLDPANKW